MLIGSGGREHALAAALNRDTTLEELHVAPGNPGIAEIALCHAIDINDNNAIVELAKKLNSNLVVVGQEKPTGPPIQGCDPTPTESHSGCFSARSSIHL